MSAESPAAARLDVRKTYKLYLGGAFPRSESGRSYPVTRGGQPDGEVLAQAAWASRKDVRDAVVAARAAQPGWAGATAYLRGQVLYRVAEVLEGRRDQLATEVADARGVDRDEALAEVAATVDRWVWFAGWSDKIAQIGGNANPVAGPYFNLSVPEPTGVIGVIAPARSPLLGLTSVVASAIVAGNTAVVLASHPRPLPAVTLGEVLATSDLPKGVVNILTGPTGELAPPLASHEDVDGLDLTGAADLDHPTWGELEAAAARTLTRVLRPPLDSDPTSDWVMPEGPRRILAFCEIKTVWHPKGR